MNTTWKQFFYINNQMTSSEKILLYTTNDTSKERGLLNADLSSIVLCPECTRNIGKIIEIPIPQDEFDKEAKRLL